MAVPMFDLGRAARRIEAELMTRWQGLVEHTAFIGGPEVEAFEEAFAAYLETGVCVGVANGTDALVLALRALDLRPGDEVVLPTFTFIATAGAVVLAGGVPVMADVEAETLNIDLDHVESLLTPRTVGILGVHLYGRPFDVDRAREIADRAGLWLLEDAAQAHGARWQERRVGGFGSLATWSFYPAKNLGAFGDGGAVTGSDLGLLERVRRLANHGREEHYFHSEVGTNSRLDALQAAVLNSRLPLLEEDNRRRREVADRYRESLAGLPGLRLLRDPEEAEPVYHQMTLLSDRRDALREHLTSRQIGSGVHYPLALHQQPAFAQLGVGEEALPVAAAAAREVLCLPMFPEIRDAEIDEVGAAVREFFAL